MIRKQVWILMLLGAVWGRAVVARAQGKVERDVAVAMSETGAVLVAGEWFDFTTPVRNEGATATPPLVAHLTITAVDTTRHVDPEDWSPLRTQFLPPLQPGETAQVDWQLHVLFEGQFAAFVTVLAADRSRPLVMSPALRLQVAPDDIMPLNDVIPVAAVVPLFPLALLVFGVVRSRRR